MRRICIAALGFTLGVLSTAGADETQPAKDVPADHAAQMKRGTDLFKKTVRQVLVKHCLKCHGGESTKADFNLATRKSLLGSGYAVAHKPDESHLLALIRHDEEPHMPAGQPKLPDKTISAIAQWIALGAPYDAPLIDPKTAAEASGGPTESERNFWSFRPLAVTSPPDVDSEWPRTAIDRFVLAKQVEQGLQPNAIADRRTLIRRAYYDLLGLPPTPEEVRAFVDDPDPHAYEQLIDRLLDSEHYGERWARHWMDVARFAESFGYEQDTDRPHAYHYRDFLIKAFNDDLPYDTFVAWQLAGDELAPENPLAMMATGFLGAGAFPTQLTEAEFESSRYDELDDMVATTGNAFLGLTLGCARCHDHKYDPVTTTEYYRLASTFTTTIRSLAEIDVPTDKKDEPVTVQVTSEGLKKIKHLADGRGFPHFYPETYFLVRGDVEQKKGVAEPGFVQVLMRGGETPEAWQREMPPDSRTSGRRADLARWITDTRDGAGNLLARVIVNRLWHHHFGRGIVATPNDFGFQGERPTHPELLDWLAADLVHRGWKLKRLHKLIMTSAVYMQGTAFDEARAQIDRDNRLLWRREPRRLEAEAIRDGMLAVSGLLDPTMYGPGTLDENMTRRSVYFFIKRSKLIPSMMLFDWPEHLVSIGARSTTTTAPQALLFLNSPLGRRVSEAFAQRLEKRPPEERIDRAYWLAVSRAPSDDERKTLRGFLESQTESYRNTGHKQPEHAALVDLCQAVLSLNEFSYVD